MSRQFKGGFISSTQPVTTLVQANGVWNLEDQIQAQAAGQWPSANPIDPYFKYTTLLLHGDGTNGAQNNTFVDSSANAFAITRNGTPTQGSFSPFGAQWSNYFAGGSDMLSLASDITLTGQFAVEAMVYYTESATNPCFMGKVASPSTNEQLLRRNANKHFFCSNNAAFSLTGTATIASNSWVHLLVTRDASNRVRLFTNGVLDATGVYSGSVLIKNIGASAASTDALTGYASNARVVSGAIPAEYQTAGTTTGVSVFSPPTSNLSAISGTVLLTCQSNRFRDASSNNYAITVSGTPRVMPFSPFAPTAAYSAAVNGGSYYSAGGSLTNVATSSVASMGFGTSDYTIEGFFYPTSTLASMRLWQFGNDADNVDVNVTSTGTISYYNGTTASTSAANLFLVNQWNHVAVSRVSGTVRVYVNGLLAITQTTTPNSSTRILYVGGNASTWFTGYISGFRVITGTGLYNGSTITVPTAPPTVVSNTSLLLNFTNAGIPDATGRNDLITVGDAQVSTAVSKWGTGSLKFDGTGDYLLLPNNPSWSFGTGNFTIEFWVYIAGNSGLDAGNARTAAIINNLAATAVNGIEVNILGSSTTTGTGIAFVNWVGSTSYSITATTTVTQGAWHFIEIVRNATITTIYLDGNSVGSGTLGNQNITVTNPTYIGGGPNSSYTHYLNGYIDDLRVTVGAARSNIVPTQAFPLQ